MCVCLFVSINFFFIQIFISHLSFHIITNNYSCFLYVDTFLLISSKYIKFISQLLFINFFYLILIINISRQIILICILFLFSSISLIIFALNLIQFFFFFSLHLQTFSHTLIHMNSHTLIRSPAFCCCFFF